MLGPSINYGECMALPSVYTQVYGQIPDFFSKKFRKDKRRQHLLSNTLKTLVLPQQTIVRLFRFSRH